MLLLEWVGAYRTVNIIKKKAILCGQSVSYAPHGIIQEQLQYDFDSEQRNKYRLPIDQQQISKLAAFTSEIWQIHPFREGNTRTTATFLIQYLRNMGLGISNALFRDSSRFFRDAFVRSNYTNIPNGIEAGTTYFIRFFANILVNTNHDLNSLDLTYYQLAPETQYKGEYFR